jgi:protein-disulfide isomerase
MSRALVVIGALAAALAVAACTYAPDDKQFGERVRAYLLAHPEVLREVSQKLQENDAKAQAAAQAQAVRDLPKYRAAIERDARDFVVNPNGRVTVTEFYDYRCPHCANVAPRVAAFIHANPDVRFVFKEMPIFGPTSEHAARAALAVKADGGDYVGLYQAMMLNHALDDAAIDRMAQQYGASAGTLISPAQEKAANDHLAETSRLFHNLALDGTPTFIIGDAIIPGEDMEAVVVAVNRQRAKLSGAS